MAPPVKVAVAVPEGTEAVPPAPRVGRLLAADVNVSAFVVAVAMVYCPS